MERRFSTASSLLIKPSEVAISAIWVGLVPTIESRARKTREPGTRSKSCAPCAAISSSRAMPSGQTVVVGVVDEPREPLGQVLGDGTLQATSDHFSAEPGAERRLPRCGIGDRPSV